MTTKSYVGDAGTIITLDCVADVSSATVRKIKARRPDGTTVVWDAVASGTNSIAFTTTADSLNQAGDWTLQAYLEMPSWSGHGEECEQPLVVHQPLS